MMALTAGEEVLHRLYPWLLAIWVLFGCWTVIHSQHVQPNTNTTNPHICRSIDIRNSGEMFESLKNCRVVEGYVQILLFDNMNSSLFENVRFPNLTEITGYLLLYRVSGLVSLGQLFPNLAVIRGQPPLLLAHALIIFEMPSLQEINLNSLTDIMNGLIRIDKNPQLCFVHTVNWKKIAHIQEGHFIKSVKRKEECPACPIDNKTGKECSHCWNNKNCQKTCPSKCGTLPCDNDGECCTESCLGGCSVATRGQDQVCNVCKNFIDADGVKCLNICADGLYPYLGRRCLSRKECEDLPKYVETSNTNTRQEYSFKIHDGECIAKCPMNFMDNSTNKTCVPCAGKCKKVCPGINVDNLESARSLTGCTHISGSLEIEVRAGANIVSGLKDHLNMIESIDGYLKIVRSFPIISLNFFKSLRVIHGKILESQKYSFIVLDNQNLQEIWDWTDSRNQTRKFEIGQGKLFFHFNPKLCYYKIEDLRKHANLPNFTDLEVAKNSNGDKTACDIKPLIVHLDVKGSTSVQMYWAPFAIMDSRRLLAYHVYYKEANSENVTLYDGRDACGQDGWTIHDVEIPRNHYSIERMHATIQQLKPFMRYGFYVKTYTIAQEISGAQSEIRYFVTNPGQPSEPTVIRLSSNSSDSIQAFWGPPKAPNGKLTHYRVTVILKQRPPQQNITYCESHHGRVPTTPKPSIYTPIAPSSNNSCSCAEGDNRSGMRKWANERETEAQINFENDLQNRVYIKQPSTTPKSPTNSRKRRQIFPKRNDTDAIGSNVNGTYIAIYNIIGTSISIMNLKHFTTYEVGVQACRAVFHNKGDILPSCSTLSTVLQHVMTQRKPDADDITSGLRKVHQTENSITISWEPPMHPNGEINEYRVEYRKQDSAPIEICRSHKAFVNNSHQITLENLDPGNYSIRVMAITGSDVYGAFTNPIIVIIDETKKSTSLTISVTVIIIVIIVALVGVYIARKLKRQESPRMNPSINPEYSYLPDDWEIPRKQIELHKELGQGSFGMVYEGIARDIKGSAHTRCAIKTVNEHATNGERANFLKEASVMKAFDTSHVIKLLGVVSQGQPTLVIMELMANGDLKSYLRSHRPDSDGYTHGIIRQPPNLQRILQMALEIADGMAYLAAKKFVHRDLAARNCMVAEDLTVKIGDFGMTRDIYETDYYRKGTKGLLPVRWMAPESLKDGIFSSSSDVWSYGVVLWEMATLASQPYQGLSNDQVLRHVIGGGIMATPENCPKKLYMLMIKCWKYKYLERPSFLDLCTLLLDDDDDSSKFSMISFYHSAAGIEARATKSNQITVHDENCRSLTKEFDENVPLNSSLNDSEIDEDLPVQLQFPHMSAVTTNGCVGTNASNGTRA